MGKTSMLQNLNKTLRIALDDGRTMSGKLLVFDKHMNVVLSDAVESRTQTSKMKREGIEPTRTLGLILLRGEHVVSVTVVKKAGEEEAANFDAAPRSKKAGAKRARE